MSISSIGSVGNTVAATAEYSTHPATTVGTEPAPITPNDHLATTFKPEPPPIKPDSLASFVPAGGLHLASGNATVFGAMDFKASVPSEAIQAQPGGLHPIAAGQATATAKESEGKGVFGLLGELRDKLQYSETAKGMIQSIGR